MDLILRQRANIPTPNIVLEDKVITSFEESVAADIYWRYEDEPEKEPIYLGSAKAGTSLQVPFVLEKAIRLFAVSRTAANKFSAAYPTEGKSYLFDPNLETLVPTIGQLTEATNTEVKIWINNFSLNNSKFRKVEVADDGSFSSGLVTTVQEAAEFPQGVLPGECLIVKPSSLVSETKYIRVSHSSNGTAYGDVSERLEVIFADSGGSGGSGGGNPCFTGETLIWALDGDIPIRDVEVGQRVICFDPSGILRDREITEKNVHDVDKYLRFMLADGRRLNVTHEHLLLDEDNKFKAAERFQNGEKLHVFEQSNELVTITDIFQIEEETEVFSIEVDEFHTHFVNRLKVHNAKQVEL